MNLIPNKFWLAPSGKVIPVESRQVHADVAVNMFPEDAPEADEEAMDFMFGKGFFRGQKFRAAIYLEGPETMTRSQRLPMEDASFDGNLEIFVNDIVVFNKPRTESYALRLVNLLVEGSRKRRRVRAKVNSQLRQLNYLDQGFDQGLPGQRGR